MLAVQIQVGGGGGCSCGNSSTGCFSCGNQMQQDDNGNLMTMTPIVVMGLDQCASDNITVCFSGGAGGGLSAPEVRIVVCFESVGGHRREVPSLSVALSMLRGLLPLLSCSSACWPVFRSVSLCCPVPF